MRKGGERGLRNSAQLRTGEDVNMGPWHLCQNELALLDVSVLIKRQGWE